MQLLDARRLTGPSYSSSSPLVVVELSLDPSEELGAVRAAYLGELARMREVLGLSPDVELRVERLRGGALFGYEAPIDVMLPCAEASEWAALSACERLSGRGALPLEPKRDEIAALMARDGSPRLLALQAEAARRGLPFLWDDERVSVGTGTGSLTFDRSAPPDPSDVPWESLAAIPVALITGTNGKTTCTRLVARIAHEAGVRAGSTSSDEIAVGGELVERGDWTGPAAARTVLRRRDVELAVLETARGGILRRGLAVAACDAALITNVGDDHLGSYGIDDLDAMARVKAVVARAVRPSGTVVLNAHDPRLVALASSLAARVVFFADADRDDPEARAVVARQRASGGECVLADAGELRVATAGSTLAVVEVARVPVTFAGAARYNVENVAASIAMARALGMSHEAIVRGITGFSPADNPRRGELLERRGVKVLLDFGHNPDGVRAVLGLVHRLRAGRPGRLTVVAGTAGDRSEHDVEEVVRAIVDARPDRVLVRELQGYQRGRAPGEVPRMFARALSACGFPEGSVAVVDSEVAALGATFASASPGDFVVVLVFLEHAAVHAFLDGLDG